MKCLIIIAILLIPSLCHSADTWTKQDTYREVTAFTVRTLDWGTTRDIAKHCDKYYEANPILGRCPSLQKVDTYFMLANFIHLGVSYVLPRGYREAFQYISIGVSASAAFSNFSTGLKVEF